MNVAILMAAAALVLILLFEAIISVGCWIFSVMFWIVDSLIEWWT